MLHKRLERRWKELREHLGKRAGVLCPDSQSCAILYKHWLRAHQEVLAGLLEVLDTKLAALDKEEKRTKPRRKVPVR